MAALRVYGDLSGEAFIFRNWRTVQIIGGDLSGSVGTNEQLYNVTILAADGVGGALTGNIEAGDRIRRLRTGAASSGLIESPCISAATFNGGFNGTIRAAGSINEFQLYRGIYNIGQLHVMNGNLLGVVTADSINMLRVSNGDIGADITVNGDFKTLRINSRDGGDMLAGSSLDVGGNLNSTSVTGDLAGLWAIDGDIGTIRVSGQVNGLTLQTPDALQTEIKSMRFGDVQDMTMTGLANVGSFQGESVAAVSIGANSITKLNIRGNMLADLILAGNELDDDDVLTNARVRGDVTDATWQLTGTVGRICLDGDISGFVLIASDSVDYLRANYVTDTQILVGLTADALDDGVVSTAEVANAGATLHRVQIGNRRGEDDTPAGSDVILAAPAFGTVMLKQIDDLGFKSLFFPPPQVHSQKH